MPVIYYQEFTHKWLGSIMDLSVLHGCFPSYLSSSCFSDPNMQPDLKSLKDVLSFRDYCNIQCDCVFFSQGFCALADHSAVSSCCVSHLHSPFWLFLFVIQKDCQCQKIKRLAVRFCLLNIPGVLDLCNLKTVVTFLITAVDMPTWKGKFHKAQTPRWKATGSHWLLRELKSDFS